MSIDHTYVSSPVVVQRWTRYTHDRAYVKIADQDLGYRDLKTGAVECSRPELVDTVTQATNDLLERAQAMAAAKEYKPRHVAPAVDTAVESPAPVDRTPTPASFLLPDRDLALNVPGQAVRQIATELRRAAPVRTRLARLVGAKTDERAHRMGESRRVV